MQRVLVTGASGTVGSDVVRMLRGQEVMVRAAVREGAEGEARAEENVEHVALDFTDRSTFAPALAGVRQLFLMRPPALTDMKRTLFPFIEAARAAGVEHILFLSLLGAERNPVVPHRQVERFLARSGVTHTLLRPSFFMQNLSTTHRPEIREGRELIVPAGRGRTSFIDARDIAEVAVRVLREPALWGGAYSLTGDEALDYFEVAGHLSAVLGEPVVYRAPSLRRFIRHWRGEGFAPGFILVMSAIYTTARLGLAATVTADARRLLGRPTRTVETFVRDHRALWA